MTPTKQLAFLEGYHDAVCILWHETENVWDIDFEFNDDELKMSYLQGFQAAYIDKEVRRVV